MMPANFLINSLKKIIGKRENAQSTTPKSFAPKISSGM
jgi:hypothetical protein